MSAHKVGEEFTTQYYQVQQLNIRALSFFPFCRCSRPRRARAMLSLTSSCRMMPRLCPSSAAKRLARHLAPLLIIYFPLPPLVSALALPLSLLQRHLYDDLR